MSPDLFIEAEESISSGEKVHEFWMCRVGFGLKTYMYGVPAFTTLRQELDGFDVSPENLRIYCEELLDDEEELENDSFVIKRN